jgi:hypothetical protein
MGIFSKWIKYFEPKVQPNIIKKNWRTSMWVIHEGRPAILFSIDSPCIIHLVDTETGETIEATSVQLSELRQATYDEIPQIRRGISREVAKELGYGS